MTIYDYILPIIVVIIIVSLVIYFRQMRRTEGFQAAEPTKFVNITKNLFIGFSDINESENNLEALKEASVKFPEQLGDKDFKHSIIINGAPKSTTSSLTTPPSVKEVCVGTGQEEAKKCIDKDKIDTSEFPKFKNNDTQVYYNEDQPIVGHNKLCIPYTNSANQLEEVCLEQKHLEKINGSYAINIKHNDNDKEIYPVNINYDLFTRAERYSKLPDATNAEEYAKALGLTLGGGGRQWDHLGNIKGLYTYNGGPYNGMAFYGVGDKSWSDGTPESLRTPLSENGASLAELRRSIPPPEGVAIRPLLSSPINNTFYTWNEEANVCGSNSSNRQTTEEAYIIYPDPEPYFGTWSHLH